jgi:tetratricopeptide (TPR) repeat protein
MVLHLPPMTENDALDLLLSGYLAEEINVHRSDWSEVAGRLGHLALSLHQAGIYLKHMKIPIGSSRDFLTTYNSKQRDVVQCLPSSFWEYWRTQCHEAATQERAISAFTTWEMILDRVGTVEGQPETFIRPFLSTLAFLDPTQIGDFIFRGWTTAAPDWTAMFSGSGEDAATTGMQSLSVAEASSNDVVEVDGAAIREETTHSSVLQIPRQWDSGKFERCVRRLYELSLLNRFSGTDARIDSFHLHPLVRDWIQAKQDANARQHYTHVAIGFVTSAYIAHGPLTTAQLWLLRVHVDACVWNDTAFVHPNYRLGHHESTCPSAECFATLSGFPGRYELARKLSSLVVETRKQCLGSEDALTLGPMNFLAEVYGHLGRKWEAEELKKQVIYIAWNARATSPIETSSFFMKMRGLVLLYQSEERYKEAENLTLDMIEKIERVSTVDGFDPLGFDMLVANRMLAVIYQMQQKWEAAIERYSSVLDANTRMLGGDSDVTLESKMDLARALVFQGRRNSAKLLEDEVKEARRTVPLVRNPHWIDNLENLSSVGEPLEARPQRSKTLRKWPNPDSTDTERIKEIIRVSKLPPEVRAKMSMGYSDNALEDFVPVSLDHSDDSNLIIRYTPLVPNKTEIRLLTLYPGEFESMIYCKLTHAFLETYPNYTALSYCWSETNEENGNNAAEIFLNDKATRVKKSAEIALRYLRKPKEHTVVWIDAICINQRDLVEKSRQVRMMDKIYSHGQLKYQVSSRTLRRS